MSAMSCNWVGRPPQQHGLGTSWLGSSSARRDLEFLEDSMAPEQQSPGLCDQVHVKKVEGSDHLPLLSTCETACRYCIQSWV